MLVLRSRTAVLSFIISIALAGIISAADFSKQKKTVLPVIESFPKIDGQLTDKVWEKASRLTNFLNLDRLKSTVSEQTEVMILSDKKNIYLGVTCYSHNPNAIKAEVKPDNRDYARLYKDDVIEFFIDPEDTGEDCYQWVINSKGAVFDAEKHRLVSTEKMLLSKEWNSDIKVRGSKNDKAWMLEVKIPLSNFRKREVSYMLSGKPWGLQVGRENWSLKDGNTQFSTWSKAYSFSEPQTFGKVVFGGKAVKEKITAWKQKSDKGLVVIDKPKRFTYPFTRIFDFGPADAEKIEEEIYGKKQQDVTHISAASIYSKENRAGFVSSEGIKAAQARDKGKTYYGTKFSPLVIDYLKSHKENTFKFDLPAGDYNAVFVSGTDMTIIDGPAPVRMQIDINGSKGVLENLVPARTFRKKIIPFKADGKEVVTVKLSPEKGVSWALKFMLIYPAKDDHLARRAFYWIERDYFLYPVEKWLDKTKLYIAHPPAKSKFISAEERDKGFALFALPNANYTPKNYKPQKWDVRGKMRTISAPGERAILQFAFHALREYKSLQVKIIKSENKIKVQPLQLKYQLHRMGRSSLKQKGYVPKLLWKVEPVWIEAGVTQGYYLVADIAEDIAPGVYSIAAGVFDGSRKLAAQEFALTVLPFRPENKKTKRSRYYNPPTYSYSDMTWNGYSSEEKALINKDLVQQLNDLKRHGTDYITGIPGVKASYNKGDDGKWHYKPSEREQMFFEGLKKTGITELVTFIPGYDSYSPGPFIINEDLQENGHPLQPSAANLAKRYQCHGKLSQGLFENLSELVRENMAARKSYGLASPAFEVWDEPGHMNAAALVPFYKAIRKGGGKTGCTLVAGCFPAISGMVDIKVYANINAPGGEAESAEMIKERLEKHNEETHVYYNSLMIWRNPRDPRAMAYWTWAWNLSGISSYKYFKITGDLILNKNSYHPLQFDENGDILSTTTNWEMVAESAFDNSLVQLIESLSAEKNVQESQAFLARLRKDAYVDLRALMGGLSSLTGGVIVDDKNWHPAKFDYIRASMCLHILKLQNLADKYPALVKEISALKERAGRQVTEFFKQEKSGREEADNTNIITNAGFEKFQIHKSGSKNIPGFPRFSNKASIDQEIFKSGKSSLIFTHQDHKGIDVVVSEGIKLKPGTTYNFKGWARRKAEKSGVAATPSTGIWLQTYSGPKAGKYARRKQLTFSPQLPSFDWQKFEYRFTLEEGENLLYIYIFNQDKNSVIHIDDLELKAAGVTPLSEILY
ncbi:MAG: sugar-binding protein [Planctomycetota bacterium]|jgi:hypothetical protein